MNLITVSIFFLATILALIILAVMLSMIICFNKLLAAQIKSPSIDELACIYQTKAIPPKLRQHKDKRLKLLDISHGDFRRKQKKVTWQSNRLRFTSNTMTAEFKMPDSCHMAIS